MSKVGSLRILIVGQVPPPFHGSNVMTQTFVEAFRELNWPYYLLRKNFSLGIAEVGRFRPVKILRFVRVYLNFISALFTYRPDLIVYFVSSKIPGLLADSVLLGTAHLLNKLTLLYVHGQGHKKASQTLTGKIIYAAVLKKTSGLIVLSDVLREDVNFFHRPIATLPNCLSKIDWDLIEKSREIQTTLRKDGVLKVVYVGNLLEAKGVFDLVRSIPRVVDKVCPVMFEFVGPWRDEDFRKQVEKFIRESNLAGYVTFSGPQFGEQKYISLINSDVFVFPSHREAFPIVDIEAMACSLPVISTRTGAIPEIVQDGVTGFVVPPHDVGLLASRIVALLKDKNLRDQMGARGRVRFVTLYTFDKYKERLYDILTRTQHETESFQRKGKVLL